VRSPSSLVTVNPSGAAVVVVAAAVVVVEPAVVVVVVVVPDDEPAHAAAATPKARTRIIRARIEPPRRSGPSIICDDTPVGPATLDERLFGS